MLLTEGGYMAFDTLGNSRYYYYLTDHLGNNRVVLSQSGTVEQVNHYYPFGMEFNEKVYANTQPYKFGGKEEQPMHRLNLYDFHARQYDPILGRFTSMDPLAEKYYAWSPYVYCLNNPLRFIDPDGKIVRQWEIYAKSRRGEQLVRSGLSAKMRASLEDYMKTDDGRAFIGQFAKAKDVIGGHKFDKDGKYSQHILDIWDRSYVDGTNGWNVPSNAEGEYIVKIDENGQATISVVVNSYSGDKYSTTEVLTHEANLHGYKAGDNVKGKNIAKDGGAKDHSAITNNNNGHEGYQQYLRIMKQLIELDPKYEKVFQDGLDLYRK